ncbi:MAG: hypothetical protein RLY43_1452, partial [Bacteroidota bacterium]
MPALLFFLQLFGLFNFVFILSIHLIIAALTLIYNWKILLNKIREFKFYNFKKIPLFFIVAISVVTFQFYSVHFNYSGALTTVIGVKMVENFDSGHPYFSDEWIAVGMSQ